MRLEKAVSLWRREHSHHACAWGRRADTEIKEAFEHLLQEAGAEHVHWPTDELFKIAEVTKSDQLFPHIDV